MFFAEGVELRALKNKYDDNYAFVKHGNGQLGAGFRINHEVARINGDIRSEHRFTQSCRRADDAFAGGNAKFALNALAMFDVQAVAENFLFFVIEHDTEDLIVDDALDLFGGAAEQLFDVKNGTPFAADGVGPQHRRGLRADPVQKPRMFSAN